MIRIEKSNLKIPIQIWVQNWEDVERNAQVQAENLASLPFAFHHISLMPDVHSGFGMPIGGILATENIIVPNAVGSDIGCGMIAVKTSLENLSSEEIKRVFSKVRELIPIGLGGKHKEKMSSSLMPFRIDDNVGLICRKEYDSALYQLSSLGSGNHFCEFQKGNDGFVWVMIHSGSRNLGATVANFYDKLAQSINTTIPKDWDLAYLSIDSQEGQNYLLDMDCALRFALANRQQMMKVFCEILENKFPNISFNKEINIHHNYASLEEHFGKQVWVHRKGATLATKDTVGIIPGSQGGNSYIVKGKGNPESFSSCSHGAGRKMGRKQAIRSLDFEKEKLELDLLGTVHSIRGKTDLDEAPGAYKDIHSVMANQTDLVDILVELTPLGTIKG